MILTVTMNPSIDVAYQLPGYSLDKIHRVHDVNKTPGGKGLNVTRVLAQLEETVVATGLLGGKHGAFVEVKLDDAAINHTFFPIANETRNCIAILHDGQQTEILESGPVVSEEEATQFIHHFESLLPETGVVTISGSLPAGIPKNYYVELAKICGHCHKQLVIDCSGRELHAVLQSEHKPNVIKPNLEELGQIVGHELDGTNEQLKAILQAPLFSGIDWVIVSQGGDGAFAKHHDNYYKVSIPRIDVVNPVGSGDAMVAGIAAGLNRNMDPVTLLKLANACGLLNAQEKVTGHIDTTRLDEIAAQIQVREV